MPAALRMPEPELINHSGLDSAVYIRIYLLGLKIFVPITALALVVLIPINWTGKGLEKTDVIFDDLDKLSISNVPEGSNRFFAHVGLAYIFSYWTCYIIYREYKVITDTRLHFISSENRRPDQFTIINVYDQKYESGATFWPDVNRCILIALVISQVALFGLLNTKGSKQTVPLLIILPILTIWFHIFCKGRFESAFVKLPLKEAMVKDILERATEPNLNLRAYLQDAYLHPVLKACDLDKTDAIIDDEHDDPVVATKRNSKMGTSKTGFYNKSDPGVC